MGFSLVGTASIPLSFRNRTATPKSADFASPLLIFAKRISATAVCSVTNKSSSMLRPFWLFLTVDSSTGYREIRRFVVVGVHILVVYFSAISNSQPLCSSRLVSISAPLPLFRFSVVLIVFFSVVPTCHLELPSRLSLIRLWLP